MSKIESILLDDSTQSEIKYKIPYTSSIFIFGENGLISGNSKYFTDSLVYNNYTETGAEEEREIADLPIKITYRPVIFSLGRKYLAIIDGVPFAYYFLKAGNIALIIRSESMLLDLDDNHERVRRFTRFLDNETLDLKNYLYVDQRLKRMNKSFSHKAISAEDFPFDMVSKKGCFFITCTEKDIKCTKVKVKSDTASMADFSFEEVTLPDVDYNEIFDYLEETNFGRKKEAEKTYHK